MNFLFGPSTVEGTEDAFQHNDKSYHYKVEYGNDGVEDIFIKDSVGRFVPIHISCIHKLMEILGNISHKHTTVKIYNELTNSSNTHTIN